MNPFPDSTDILQPCNRLLHSGTEWLEWCARVCEKDMTYLVFAALMTFFVFPGEAIFIYKIGSDVIIMKM